MEENKVIIEKPKYKFYQKMIESKGYVFKKHVSPFDIYNDGTNELSICATCRAVRFNGVRVMNIQFTEAIIDVLFNK